MQYDREGGISDFGNNLAKRPREQTPAPTSHAKDDLAISEGVQSFGRGYTGGMENIQNKRQKTAVNDQDDDI